LDLLDVIIYFSSSFGVGSKFKVTIPVPITNDSIK
jgi:hypothetical protein